jgi:hypothetical protein
MKLEVVVPLSDGDRTKRFYANGPKETPWPRPMLHKATNRHLTRERFGHFK